MKRLLVPLVVVLLLVTAAPAFAEWELGLSWTPVTKDVVTQTGTQTVWDAMFGTHVGLSLAIFYGSWDAIAIPNTKVEMWTNSAYSVPGFVNLFDAGLKLTLKPIELFAEAGTNMLYVYKQSLLSGSFGVNFRVGVGLRFGGLGITLAGTSLFNSFDELGGAFADLGSSDTRDRGWTRITGSMFPSLGLALYF